MEMQVVAWLAAGLVFLTFFMKTLVPLRTVAIASNVVFITYGLMGLSYGIFDKVLPILVLHLALLPLNIFRLIEINASISKCRLISGPEDSFDILVPDLKHEDAMKRIVLFKIGDESDNVFLIRQGKILFPEVGWALTDGQFFGKVGPFLARRWEASSAVCQDDFERFTIAGEKVVELIYQDFRSAFVIVRAISQYLSETTSPNTEGVG